MIAIAGRRIGRAEKHVGEDLLHWMDRLGDDGLSLYLETGEWPPHLHPPAWVREELAQIRAEVEALSDDELLALLPG
ncbi:MAG: hypothetical protein HY321_12350 [Armatimonadetes bacterium]|nr:hypothetical protein [Armatimonadota bacterium]